MLFLASSLFFYQPYQLDLFILLFCKEVEDEGMKQKFCWDYMSVVKDIITFGLSMRTLHPQKKQGDKYVFIYYKDSHRSLFNAFVDYFMEREGDEVATAPDSPANSTQAVQSNHFHSYFRKDKKITFLRRLNLIAANSFLKIKS